MSLLPWHVWMMIGIGCIIIEIFDPAFFFVSLGIGAIVTGICSMVPLVGDSIPLQIMLFAIFSFISFLFMRKLGKKVLKNTTNETNVYALKGKTGFITKEIPAEGKGYVKMGGEEWPALEESQLLVELGSKVEVVGIDGNKLIVKKV